MKIDIDDNIWQDPRKIGTEKDNVQKKQKNMRTQT